MYGLGATFYALLTGTTPIDAITRVTQRKGIDPLVPAHLVVPSVPWATAMAIEKAMSISCDDRFESVEKFWQELNNQTPKQQVVLEEQLEPLKISTPALQNKNQSPTSRKGAFNFIVLATIFTLAIGTALVFALLHNTRSLTTQRTTPTLAPTTSQVTTTPSNVSTPIIVYPEFGSAYAGTVLDMMNNENTSLFLTHIHQNGGNITGYFQGLGMAGPFKGTVTHPGHLQFTVTVQGGSSLLIFEGDIKIGGDITGTFKALNQQRQFTGESGIWNAAHH